MRWRRSRQSGDSAEGFDERIYDLPDPALSAYDHGLGTLSVDEEVKGYLASVIGEMQVPSRQPWPWFVVVWADGTKERAFEDYGPGWWTVRELDAGRLEHIGPSVEKQKRVSGRSVRYTESDPPCVYDFAWLPVEEAAEKWQELKLGNDDF